MKKICPTNLFPGGYRASGVVLDVAALPSRHGIGDLGPGSMSWVDRLHESGQSWWEALQWGKTRCCDSMSQYSSSSFAGDPLLISPDWLIDDGLLAPRDCDRIGLSAGSIDYDVVIPFKYWLFEKAWKRFNAGRRKDLVRAYERFCVTHGHWLESHSLFCALKAKYRGAHYREWPAKLIRRDPIALADARHELASEIDQVRFLQFILSRQIRRLREYAHSKGVRLIGNLAFFVFDDSSEVWSHPELFVSAGPIKPGAAAALVPLCFSSGDRPGSGSDRGALNRVSYRWCVDRVRALLTHVDVARVDVRALAAPWLAADDEPADRGNHVHGIDYRPAASGLVVDGLSLEPGKGFAFRNRFHVPETRLLQFAFDGRPDNPHLPKNYTPNSVVYAGTHDGLRTGEWFSALPDQQRQALWDCLKRPSCEKREVAWGLINAAWSSVAALAMVPFPDLLNPESEQVGKNGHTKNRRWRCTEAMISATAFDRLSELTRASDRSADLKVSPKPAVLRSSPTRTVIEAAL